MHGMGITTSDEQQEVLDTLQNRLKLIDSKIEPEQLAKPGRRAQLFFTTPTGIQAINKILNNR